MSSLIVKITLVLSLATSSAVSIRPAAASSADLLLQQSVQKLTPGIPPTTCYPPTLCSNQLGN